MAKCDQVPCVECGKKLYVNWTIMAVIISGEGAAYCMKCALPYIMDNSNDVKIHDAMRGDLSDLTVGHFSEEFINVINEMREDE